MTIPTAKEINPFDDLDGIEAERNFLGKTVDDAIRLFEDVGRRSQEDLMWMGPVGFVYYLPAAVRYLESEAAKDDPWDVASAMAMVIDFRLDHDATEITEAFPMIRRLAHHVMAHAERFEELPDFREELILSYRVILERLDSLVKP